MEAEKEMMCREKLWRYEERPARDSDTAILGDQELADTRIASYIARFVFSVPLQIGHRVALRFVFVKATPGSVWLSVAYFRRPSLDFVKSSCQRLKTEGGLRAEFWRIPLFDGREAGMADISKDLEGVYRRALSKTVRPQPSW
jgi:hypothetical protein